MTDIFHGRTLAMDLVEEKDSRAETYKLVEHLNAAVNISRAKKRHDVADQIKEAIRLLNSK